MVLTIFMKMTELILSNDPRYFKQTSYEPYDRHHYKIVSKHYATFIVESWDEVQEWWWNHCNMINFDARIEVLDEREHQKKLNGPYDFYEDDGIDFI